MRTTLFQRSIVALLSVICAAPAWADGTITHLSGKISVQKADGTLLTAAVGAKVGESDTMITGINSYARLEMTDGGEIVLRPNSQLKVESYRFNSGKPAEDKFVFSMLKGGLRTVTGLIGKRGNQDAYEGKTATATVGIRGTQYDLRLCQGDCGALADGTYLAVRFGAVRAGNPQGSIDLAAGQVALVPSAKPPVLLPRDPGVGFTPPAVIPKLDEKKKQKAAAAESAQPAQEKPEGGSSEKPTPSDSQDKQGDKKDEKKEDKQQEKKQEKQQDGHSDSGEKQESTEVSGTDNKSDSKATGSPGSASSGSPSASGGGSAENSAISDNNLEPISQTAQGTGCAIQ